MLAVFRDAPPPRLGATPVVQYWRLAPDEAADATVVLRVAGSGDPLLVEHPLGGGRVLLLTTTPQPEWTALPLLPSFVPLLQEMLAWSLTTTSERHNTIVGERPTSRANVSGFYSAPAAGLAPQPASPAAGETLYAANVDTRESDLSVVDAANLDAVLGESVRIVASGQKAEDSGQRAVGRASAGHSILPGALLVAALVLVLLDTVWSSHLAAGLARRFPHIGPTQMNRGGTQP
jgi:hypothetical protein